MGEIKDIFQPSSQSWSDHAKKGELRSVIDPNDLLGNKNIYIDTLQKMAIGSILSKDKKENVVVDFGCGSGRITRYLSQFANRVIGVDITKEMMDIARTINKRENIEYILIDGINIPVSDGSVDLVVTVGVLQYIVKKRDIYEQIIREIRRILKPTGKILFIEQASLSNRKSSSLREVVATRDYLDVLDRYFRVEKIHPVRTGGNGLIDAILYHRYFPTILYPVIAKIDLWKTARYGEAKLSNFPYIDYLFYARVL